MSEPADLLSSGVVGEELARQLDQQDDLKHMRDEFNVPSKADISRTVLPPSTSSGQGPSSSLSLMIPLLTLFCRRC